MRVRILADDLTGALDSAARFVPLTGAMPVVWRDAVGEGSAAIDCGTREVDAAAACDTVKRLSRHLAGSDIAFKKIDSLLRGHVAAELDALMPGFDHCVLAPAFPHQGRVTRGGRQLVRDGEQWRDTGVDMPPPARGWLCDAESDADLAGVVTEGRRLAGRVLWCGTGGLAGALAGHRAVPRPALPGPLLALVGSDHPVSVAQLQAVRHLHHRLGDGGAPSAAAPAAVTVWVPSGTERPRALRIIVDSFAAWLRTIPRPGTLFVTGGETLRHLCDALGVTHLEVDGELEPGVPTSRLRGGSWDGQRVVSKSGAFGHTGFLRDLLGGRG